jgi:hypothetical protein
MQATVTLIVDHVKRKSDATFGAQFGGEAASHAVQPHKSFKFC